MSFPEQDTGWIEPGALREDTLMDPVRTSDVYYGDVREDPRNLVAINPLCCAGLRKTDHALNPERSGVLRSSIYARDIGKEIDPCREHAGEENEEGLCAARLKEARPSLLLSELLGVLSSRRCSSKFLSRCCSSRVV